MSMKLHGLPISPYVRKTRVALELKGLEYERTDVYPGTRTPEYLAISPLGKIPAFEDGNVIMCDSNVIVEYLEEMYPTAPVRPASVTDRARCRWLEEYAGSMLFGPCAGSVFMERMTKPFMTGEPEDESVVEDAIANQQPPLFDYVESQLPAEGFIFGAFSIADIAVATALINATYADWEVDGERWPRLRAHLQLVKEHPAVAKCMQDEVAIVDALTNARRERLAQVGSGAGI